MLSAERRDQCDAGWTFSQICRTATCSSSKKCSARAPAQPEDADPAHRLRGATRREQPVLDVDPLTGNEFTHIEWGDEDALPFPLCLSSRTDEEHGEEYLATRQRRARQHRACAIMD